MVVDRFKRRIGWLKEIKEEYNQLSRMPLSKRLNELKRLDQEKSGLEERLKVTKARIRLLERMPDVAEYRIVRDEIAMVLIEKLKERGDIAYRDLEKRLGIRDPYTIMVIHYLELLKTAGLVEMSPDPTFPGGMDPIIKLTERGKTLQYVKQK